MGIGISGTHFQFDGAAHMNLKFKRPDDTSYILEYEPVLVSPHITICIFDIHSEFGFKSAARDHGEKFITFVPTDGQMVQMPYLEEKSDGRSAFDQVSKATFILNNELCWISGQIKGINIKESNSATPFLFEGEPELKLGLTDFKLDLREKNIKVPLFNDSGADVTLRKGVQLGTLTELHNEKTVIPDVSDNVLCDATEFVDTNLDAKVKELIDNYQSKLNDTPESQGSVENAECGVRSVENAECGKCGVWKTRSVENAECGKCGV